MVNMDHQASRTTLRRRVGNRLWALSALLPHAEWRSGEYRAYLLVPRPKDRRNICRVCFYAPRRTPIHILLKKACLVSHLRKLMDIAT